MFLPPFMCNLTTIGSNSLVINLWAIAFHERLDRLRKALFTNTTFKIKATVTSNLSLSLDKHHDLRINASLGIYRHAFSIWKLGRVQRRTSHSNRSVTGKSRGTQGPWWNPYLVHTPE